MDHTIQVGCKKAFVVLKEPTLLAKRRKALLRKNQPQDGNNKIVPFPSQKQSFIVSTDHGQKTVRTKQALG